MPGETRQNTPPTLTDSGDSRNIAGENFRIVFPDPKLNVFAVEINAAVEGGKVMHRVGPVISGVLSAIEGKAGVILFDNEGDLDLDTLKNLAADLVLNPESPVRDREKTDLAVVTRRGIVRFAAKNMRHDVFGGGYDIPSFDTVEEAMEHFRTMYSE